MVVFFVFLAIWGPAFTFVAYGYGVVESELDLKILKNRHHPSFYIRCWGTVVWIFFNQINRWIVSLVGFLMLFAVRIG
ncbi:hypothetical protein ABIE13_000727 [Ottowia thiooxydans]|uniref:Uncharacterized protein n=1 Tax=Ottowia thiooxydans TaxID=219182 RepID=A0ABV2Q3N6_9BURK